MTMPIGMVLLFLILLPGLFGLYVLNPIEHHIVDPFTTSLAHVSAFITHFFDGRVEAHGKQLMNAATGYAVTIERGCNGVEAVIILVSAMLAFPAPWKNRLIGIALGFVAIQALNLVRIISLFYLGQWNQTWFEWFHLYLWQALIIIDALVVFLIWLRYLPPIEAAPAEAIAT